ncbi:MAG: hypothetical protein JO202_10630, partial [Ktedonobacteraceae bacterium]|nr:hypothetical protein [Ktedonobacteraceae bacterium]
AGLKGAEIAASQGLSFCFAQFFQKRELPQAMEIYRQQFCPSQSLYQARASLAVRVICADTEKEAQRLASSFWQLVLAFQGSTQLHISPEGLLRIPLAEEVENYVYSERDYQFMRENELMMIAGNPTQVKERLIELAQLYGVDELIVLTICPDMNARLHSYQLLAQAFGLQSETDKLARRGNR